MKADRLPAGSFNEWGSFFLFGSDLLLALLLFLWFLRSPKKFRLPVFKNFAFHNIFLALFIIFSIISLAVSAHPALGWYRLIKVLEFTGLYFYIQASFGLIFDLKKAFLAVVCSAFFQSLIAIGQSLRQQDLGLKWLGESVLRTNFKGVAVVLADGEKFLRAYGTLPHPNVLAGWLFLAIFAFYFYFLYLYGSGHKPRKPWFTVYIIYPIILLALLLTFSRTAVGLLALGVAVRLFLVLLKKDKYRITSKFKQKVIRLLLASAAVALVFVFIYWPQVKSRVLITSQDPAVQERIFYNKVAKNIVLANPVFGVGPGQFVNALIAEGGSYPDYVLQPVHNIYLLIASETGLTGLSLFLAWLIFLLYDYIRRTKLAKLYQASFFILFLSILAMGLFDHFLWTLQQGQLIFWLVIALLASVAKQEKKIYNGVGSEPVANS